MKKITVLLIYFFISISILFSFIPGPFGKDKGGITGKFYVVLNSSHPKIGSGSYFGVIQFYLKNKNTGMSLLVNTDKNGYFYRLNINPGFYEIINFQFEYDNQAQNIYYVFDELILRNADNTPMTVVISVHEHTISVVKPFIAIFNIRQSADKSDNASGGYYVQRTENLDDVIKNFKDQDRSNKWGDYEFGDFEVNNPLSMMPGKLYNAKGIMAFLNTTFEVNNRQTDTCISLYSNKKKFKQLNLMLFYK